MRRLIQLTALYVLVAAPALAAGPPAKFVEHGRPKPVADVAFVDEAGAPQALSDFYGRFVLLNIWATWCGPCVREMPTLDRLQAQLGSDRFQVLALSIDRAGVAPVRTFYDKVGIERLSIFVDSSGQAARDLSALGLPTTLLISPDGLEIGRLIGPAEWDAPEVVAYLQELLRRDAD